jgi:hypothetical protein
LLQNNAPLLLRSHALPIGTQIISEQLNGGSWLEGVCCAASFHISDYRSRFQFKPTTI